MSSDRRHDGGEPWWAVAFPGEGDDPVPDRLTFDFDFETTAEAPEAWDDADFEDLDFTQWLDPDDVEPIEAEYLDEELFGIEAEVIELTPERRRDGDRVTHLQSVVMVRKNNRQAAVMHNMSPRGLVIAADCSSQPGSFLGVEVPTEHGGVSLETEVRWVRLQDAGAPESFQVGLRVINPPATWLAYYEHLRWPTTAACAG